MCAQQALDIQRENSLASVRLEWLQVGLDPLK
jgi:hypothetical protein